MTDDKAVGGGPYKVGGDLAPGIYLLDAREALIANVAYAEGVKAERERCLAIDYKKWKKARGFK